MVKVLIKKLSKDIKFPNYKTYGSSGLDLIANLNSDLLINVGEKNLVPTGIAVAIPQGYEIQIRPRSGLASRNGITVLNTPGTIDADYRGEIKVILINHGKEAYKVTKGQRVAQMVLCPVIRAEFEEVTELPSTERGEGGFGSTGKWNC